MPMTAETASAADAGERDVADEFAVEIEAFHLGLRIAQILAEHLAAHGADALQQDLRHFGHDDAPVAALRLADVDGDDFVARRIQIREEVEDGAVVVDEVVACVVVVEQFHDRSASGYLLVEDAVLWLGAEPDLDNEVVAIFRDAAAEAPLGLVFALVDELILALRFAERVEVELVEFVLGRERRSGLGLVVA